MNFETLKQEANVAAWLTLKNLITRARDQSFHGKQASCNTPRVTFSCPICSWVLYGN